MSSVSNYKEAHRRDELEFILLAVDAFHECVRPPAASDETPLTFHQSYLGNSSRVLAIGDDDLTFAANRLRDAYWARVVEHPFVAVCMFVALATDAFLFDARFTKIVLSLPAQI